MGIMCLTFAVPAGDLRVLMVVDDSSIDRLREHDPIELELGLLEQKHLERHGAVAKVGVIGIVWASAAEREQIIGLVSAGRVTDAIEFACRGFRNRPDQGDGDGVVAVAVAGSSSAADPSEA
jgi:hypothetical protein